MSYCTACKRDTAAPDALQCPDCQQESRRTATDAPAARQVAATLPVRSEAEIQAEIVAWLRLHGWDVTVTSAHRHAKGVTAGTPDLYCRRAWEMPPEYSDGFGGPWIETDNVWIEVKRPGGKVSKAQAAWHEDERRCGGTVIVAYGIEDVQQLA